MDKGETIPIKTGDKLRRGWTTGACATAAAKAALSRLLLGDFEDPACITLPGGQTPAFALAHEKTGENWAEAGIIKDAGDDPDVTHGALIITRVAHAPAQSGIRFFAGTGVGTVTKPGLPLAVGEPAINPVPRKMIIEHLEKLCDEASVPADFDITISVEHGQDLAKKTWNPRLGILGGLSILGTTGIVVPYSCSAWIHSIHRGVDVARAIGLRHVVGSTGDRSEQAARQALGLAEEAYLDMGDFAGGLLKYLRSHHVDKVTIAGGFAKLTKLAQGAMDLHSGRSQVDPVYLAELLRDLGADEALVKQATQADSANQILEMAKTQDLPLAESVADAACIQAQRILDRPEIKVSILVINRAGDIIAQVG